MCPKRQWAVAMSLEVGSFLKWESVRDTWNFGGRHERLSTTLWRRRTPTSFKALNATKHSGMVGILPKPGQSRTYGEHCENWGSEGRHRPVSTTVAKTQPARQHSTQR